VLRLFSRSPTFIDRCDRIPYLEGMKNKNAKHEESNLQHVLIPFGDDKPKGDGLFDDCPLCQKLRKEIEDGRASPMITVNLDDFEDDKGL
jgi:hypothetical protein